MEIKRLQIEGGFLSGFDVAFSSGLNVLIGARGTGKTSIIELIRFALAARNHTPEAAARSADHAGAVLEDGSVTIKIGDSFDTVTVSRATGEDLRQTTWEYDQPFVFSQTEIENLGLSEAGRLRLLDSFISGSATLAVEEDAAIAAIRSAFKEITAAEIDRTNLSIGLDRIEALQERINMLEHQELQYRAKSADLEDKQKQLAEINVLVSASTVREGVLRRFVESTDQWASTLAVLVSADFGAEAWDPLDGEDPLDGLRSEYATLVSEIQALERRFGTLNEKASIACERLETKRQRTEGTARDVREEVETLVAGAGSISRHLSQARTEVAQLMSRRKLVDERDQYLLELRMRRDKRIKDLDLVRYRRFTQREDVAKSLTKSLSPQIRISVDRYGQYAEYSKALIDALRGSGMRYTDLVPALTESVSPHELVKFIDSNDFVSLADLASIPSDRAARVLGYLRENGASDFVVASIEDNVRMSLLDGVDYKDVENLSAGQRCTVILSIILQHTSRTLIIDQPEDHLDNAYIATTVIKAIRNRKQHGQLIISTHNANIPVLGGADLVIEMTSDGRNGFVQVCEQLSGIKAVDAITNVMEGGREAFSNRAAFYEEHEI